MRIINSIPTVAAITVAYVLICCPGLALLWYFGLVAPGPRLPPLWSFTGMVTVTAFGLAGVAICFAAICIALAAYGVHKLDVGSIEP